MQKYNLNQISRPYQYSSLSCFYYQFHKATGQFWGELARRLADDYILPLDVRQYSKALQKYQTNIVTNIKELGLDSNFTEPMSMYHAML